MFCCIEEIIRERRKLDASSGYGEKTQINWQKKDLKMDISVAGNIFCLTVQKSNKYHSNKLLILIF